MSFSRLLLAALALSPATAFTRPFQRAAVLKPATRTIVQAETPATAEYGASGTSFYTKTEKQDSYDALETVLNAKCKDGQVRVLIGEMLEACADITDALRSALVTVEGSANTFGDAQLSVDVIADEILWEMCKKSKTIAFGASEEDPVIRAFPDNNGEYTVCWDPLDGSSIVDNNWAV